LLKPKQLLRQAQLSLPQAQLLLPQARLLLRQLQGQNLMLGRGVEVRLLKS
jgi:hypothetical protein